MVITQIIKTKTRHSATNHVKKATVVFPKIAGSNALPVYEMMEPTAEKTLTTVAVLAIQAEINAIKKLLSMA